MKTLLQTLTLLACLCFVGCGEMSSGDPDQFNAAVQAKSQSEVELPDGRRVPIIPTEFALPACDSETRASVYFIQEVKLFKICTGQFWDIFNAK